MNIILENIFKNEIDIYDLADKFYDIRTPFTGLNKPEITYNSWKYSIKHLPMSIFTSSKYTINYILHLPGDYYKSEDNDNGEKYTFAYYPVYGGEYYLCEYVKNSKSSCIIHINLRDIYTDSLDFISNLILHIKFMELNKNDTIIICNKKDECNRNNLCKAFLKSDAINCNKLNKEIENNKELDNDKFNITEINLNNPPKYSVNFNSLNFKKACEYLPKKWDMIFANILNKIIYFCKTKNFKIHIIQGAVIQFTLMTTKHPYINLEDLNNIKLTNNYGGIYKKYDEYLAKIYKKNGLQRKILKELSKKWYSYNSENSISYNLINLNNVVLNNCMDPIFKELVKKSKYKKEKNILLNITHCFGSDSYYVAKSMLKIFGEKLKSFQIIGKAGGIGDKIKLNDYIITDKLDLSYKNHFINIDNDIIHKKTSMNISSLNINKNLLSGTGKIYKSGVKTMPCVLFEPIDYLRSIKHEFNAIEMESYWINLGFNNKIPTNYLYYISDLPLEKSLAFEIYPVEEGQSLFNGLIRIAFDWLNHHIINKNISKTKKIIHIKKHFSIKKK